MSKKYEGAYALWTGQVLIAISSLKTSGVFSLFIKIIRGVIQF